MPKWRDLHGFVAAVSTGGFVVVEAGAIEGAVKGVLAWRIIKSQG